MQLLSINQIFYLHKYSYFLFVCLFVCRQERYKNKLFYVPIHSLSTNSLLLSHYFIIQTKNDKGFHADDTMRRTVIN